MTEETQQSAIIAAWAAYGVALECDKAGYWQWCETASDDDPPDWLGALSPPFSTFDRCVADLEHSFGQIPDRT